MSGRGTGLYNLLDLLKETFVQQTVSFVENKDFDAFEAEAGSVLDVVNQPGTAFNNTFNLGSIKKYIIS